jgi:ATP-binding cassette subfamily C protein
MATFRRAILPGATCFFTANTNQQGSGISGGQRQRIAIARALVHKPQLLILDETTASLDPESEAAICITVQRLRGDMTVLAISHQPALLEAADCVYHLEEGTVQLVRTCAASTRAVNVA